MATPDPIEPTAEEIAARARQLWQAAGQPAGREEEYRRGALAELRKDRAKTVAIARDNPGGERRPGQVAPPS